jgi:hypothetical protein
MRHLLEKLLDSGSALDVVAQGSLIKSQSTTEGSD